MNASTITKITSWFKFLGKNLHLVGCATVYAKSEFMLTHTIVTRDLWFYHIYEDHFFVLKEFFSENSFPVYDLYSRAIRNQERVMMLPVRYLDRRKPISPRSLEKWFIKHFKSKINYQTWRSTYVNWEFYETVNKSYFIVHIKNRHQMVFPNYIITTYTTQSGHALGI